MPSSTNKLQLASHVGLTMLFLAGLTAASDAQVYPLPPPTFNPSNSEVVPTAPEQPVSPSNPGSIPGSTSGSTGINPITGLPCVGTGASATGSGGQIGQNSFGLPPSGSVYEGAC